MPRSRRCRHRLGACRAVSRRPAAYMHVMITALEVRSVPAFAMLGDAEAERLARHSADLRLERGEYAVHEGDGRSLYAVLEGEAEVTKAIDGVERIVGRRVAGEIFGGVPLVLGTPFPAGIRAAGPCRIMRIE